MKNFLSLIFVVACTSDPVLTDQHTCEEFGMISFGNSCIVSDQNEANQKEQALDCKLIDESFYQKNDTCESICVSCIKFGGVCLDINNNGYPDTCTATKKTNPLDFCPDDDWDGYVSCNEHCVKPLDKKCGDCNDLLNDTNPDAKEICDGFDTNCDGNKDEDLKSVFYHDLDQDGFGDAYGKVTLSCMTPKGMVNNHKDCNDQNPNIHMEALEICGNSVDENCNGMTNDLCPSDPGSEDKDQDGYVSLSDCDDLDPKVNPSTTCPKVYVENGKKMLVIEFPPTNGPYTETFEYSFLNKLSESKDFFGNSNKISLSVGPSQIKTAKSFFVPEEASLLIFNQFVYPGSWNKCKVNEDEFSIPSKESKIWLIKGGVWKDVTSTIFATTSPFYEKCVPDTSKNPGPFGYCPVNSKAMNCASIVEI